jgi:adenylate cyclase
VRCVSGVRLRSWRPSRRTLHRNAVALVIALVAAGVAALLIAREPERISLGSQRRMLSVLFADLQDFTPFAERSDPDQVSRVVAEFLEAMTAVIFEHGGTVDKFIGDSVMALWNAPLDDSQHASHACQAALAMQAALDALGERWEADGLPRQRMRIGVHTGLASVGNMGAPRRFAYTAIGDTVNVAARLEPLNATYGTRICVSEASFEAAGGRARWLVRWLDRVAVKGRAATRS